MSLFTVNDIIKYQNIWFNSLKKIVVKNFAYNSYTTACMFIVYLITLKLV